MKNVLISSVIWLLACQPAFFAQLPPRCDETVKAGDEPPGCLVCWPVYQGTTGGYTADALGVDFPCGTIENNQWLSYLVNQSNISATIIPSDCMNGKGVEMRMYDQNLMPVSTCFSAGLVIPGTFVATGLTPGEVYWIMIDGYEGDICDFTIIVQGGIIQWPGGIPGYKPGIFQVSPGIPCIGTEVCYRFEHHNVAVSYHWEVPDFGQIISGDSTDKICVKFDRPGKGKIKSLLRTACYDFQTETDVFIPNTNNPEPEEFTFCTTNFPVYVNGVRFNDYGQFNIPYDTMGHCGDSLPIYIQRFSPQPDTIVIDTTYCFRDPFRFFGSTRIRSGRYVLTEQGVSANGCDSTIILNATVIHPIKRVSINPNRRILTSLDKLGPYQWINCQNNAPVAGARSQNFLPAVSGEYAVIVGYGTCQDTSDCFTVELKHSVTPPGDFFDWKIFPNPVRDELHVEIQSPTIDRYAIRLFDAAGRKHAEQYIDEDHFTTRIGMAALPYGLYFLQLSGSQGTISHKVAKY